MLTTDIILLNPYIVLAIREVGKFKKKFFFWSVCSYILSFIQPMHVNAFSMSDAALILVNQGTKDGIPPPTVLFWFILQMHMLGDEKMM